MRRTINELQCQIHRTALEKGWWDPPYHNAHDPIQISGKLCLIHSEVSEALEEIRMAPNHINNVRFRENDNKPEGFPTELADIVIRVFDLSEALGIDLERAILEKMKYNDKRPYKHGGKSL